MKNYVASCRVAVFHLIIVLWAVKFFANFREIFNSLGAQAYKANNIPIGNAGETNGLVQISSRNHRCFFLWFIRLLYSHFSSHSGEKITKWLNLAVGTISYWILIGRTNFDIYRPSYNICQSFLVLAAKECSIFAMVKGRVLFGDASFAFGEINATVLTFFIPVRSEVYSSNHCANCPVFRYLSVYGRASESDGFGKLLARWTSHSSQPHKGPDGYVGYVHSAV